MLSLADIGQKISNSNVQMFISILNDAAVLFCLSSSAIRYDESNSCVTIRSQLPIICDRIAS